MFSQSTTRAFCAVIAAAFLFGVGSFICAQEREAVRREAVRRKAVQRETVQRETVRSTEEIQAEIQRLQAELQQAKESKSAVISKTNSPEQSLPGNYLGMEGNDWIGIVIGQPENNVYPITIYEDGLPHHGFEPKDDDKYIGTAIINAADQGRSVLKISLNQKFDEQREEAVEQPLREIQALIETDESQNEIVITIPRNREWGPVRVVGQSPAPQSKNAEKLTPATGNSPGTDALAGRYLGREGDDRLGMILTPTNKSPGTFNIVFYEDGLPGAGYNRRDDDRYEGTATLQENTLNILITKKFDEDREEPVEEVLQQLTATVNVEQDGAVRLSIPRNPEWDTVSLRKL